MPLGQSMSGRMVLGGREGYHSPIVRLLQGSSWCVRGYPTVLHVRTSHFLSLGVELCGAEWVRAQMIPTDVRASCGVVPHSFEDHTRIPLQGLRLVGRGLCYSWCPMAIKGQASTWAWVGVPYRASNQALVLAWNTSIGCSYLCFQVFEVSELDMLHELA